MTVPARPKIYHIVHWDRLSSIIEDGQLWCDAEIMKRAAEGTTIGMNSIKQRRLRNCLHSYPDLHVGDCVPFYFCPRSIMLYLIYQGNHPDLEYRGGQGPVIHLEADLRTFVRWAEKNEQRWAFTLSNAGSGYFDDYCNLEQLHELNWDAIEAKKWSGGGVSPSIKEGKQAEFLVERSFSWKLVSRIGVYSKEIANRVYRALGNAEHRPDIEIKKMWYY